MCDNPMMLAALNGGWPYLVGNLKNRSKVVESTEIESKVKELTEEFVSDHWQRAHAVCYLSSLGVQLNRAIPRFRDSIPMGLREFLRQNPVVQVVEFPGIEQKVGAVPLSVSLPDDTRELFSQEGQEALSKSQRTAYVQEFWDAFVDPIMGDSRYVIVDEGGHVSVRDDSAENLSGTVYEITREDLSSSPPNQPIAIKVEATHAAIDSWLQKQSLEARVFARPRAQRWHPKAGSRLARLLGALDGLPDEDLSRIRIPADILIKLSSKDGD